MSTKMSGGHSYIGQQLPVFSKADNTDRRALTEYKEQRLLSFTSRPCPLRVLLSVLVPLKHDGIQSTDVQG